MNEIAKAFEQSFINNRTYTIIRKTSVVAIKTIETLGLNIPIFSLLVEFCDLAINIKWFRFAKKIHRFLVNLSDTTEEERTKFLQEMSNMNKDNASEILVDTIDNLNNINKVDILTNLIKARIKEELSLENFMRLSIILERIAYTDLNELEKYVADYYEEGSTDALLSAGVIFNTAIDFGDKPENTNKYRLNILGLLLLKYGMERNVKVEIKNNTSTPTPREMTAKELDEIWRETLRKKGIVKF